MCIRDSHATGIEESDNKGYGDPVSNAAAMAFKRACAMFGLGRHLYQKETPMAQPKPAPAAKPVASSLDQRILEVSKDLLKAGTTKQELAEFFTGVTKKTRREELTDAEKANFLTVANSELQERDERDDPFGGDE